jgi:hypothetical protein
MIDEMYHTCRWCKYYDKGYCHNKAFGGYDDIGLYEVAESGRLSEVIEETLNSIDPKSITDELKAKLKSYKISDKRVEEVLTLFKGCMAEFLDMECKPALDERVSILYQSAGDGMCDIPVYISEPESFYCKHFE